MSQLLRVNMSDLSCKYEDVPEKYRHWAARGLTSSLTFDEVPPNCHPLGIDNKVIIAPGIVSGTKAPTSGRTSFGGKSPLTGIIKETNAGGLSSQKIARLGIKAIILEGQPDEKDNLWLLKLTTEGAELLPTDHLKNKGMYELPHPHGNRRLHIGLEA